MRAYDCINRLRHDACDHSAAIMLEYVCINQLRDVCDGSVDRDVMRRIGEVIAELKGWPYASEGSDRSRRDQDAAGRDRKRRSLIKVA